MLCFSVVAQNMNAELLMTPPATALAPVNRHINSTSIRLCPPGFTLALMAALLLAWPGVASAAGIAYGTVSNFDTVNDTGVECHGFEIELDDIHSSDITYTYDYNHYGTPKITEDTWSVPGHTNVIVRNQAIWTRTARCFRLSHP
jgi:hypothetical protein